MEYLPTFINQLDVDYISHHGIKGQRWGVRRYQNPDGSLTPAGRRKYKKDYKRTYKDVQKAAKNGQIRNNYTNRDRIENKMFEEGQNSKIVKEYLEFDKTLSDFIKDTAKKNGVNPGKIVISSSDPLGSALQKHQNAAKADLRRITHKYLDQYADALMSDLDIEITDGGRAAVKDILISTGYEDLLWG